MHGIYLASFRLEKCLYIQYIRIFLCSYMYASIYVFIQLPFRFDLNLSKALFLYRICLLNELSNLRQLMMEVWQLPKRVFLARETRFQSASCQPC